MARKTKSDSIAGQLETKQLEDGYIDPPAHLPMLTKVERAYWDSYIRSRANWRESDLVVLREIVRMDMDLRDIREQMETEGYTDFSAQGASVINPLQVLYNQRYTLRTNTCRSIQLNITAKAGEALNNSGVKVKPKDHSNAPTKIKSERQAATDKSAAARKAKAVSLVK